MNDESVRRAIATGDTGAVRAFFEGHDVLTDPAEALGLAVRCGGPEMTALLLRCGVRLRVPDGEWRPDAYNELRRSGGYRPGDSGIPCVPMDAQDWARSVQLIAGAGDDLRDMLYGAALHADEEALGVLFSAGVETLRDEHLALVTGKYGRLSRERGVTSTLRASFESDMSLLSPEGLAGMIRGFMACKDVDRIAVYHSTVWGEHGIGTKFCAPEAFDLFLECTTVRQAVHPESILFGLIDYENVSGLRRVLAEERVIEPELAQILTERARGSENVQLTALLLSLLDEARAAGGLRDEDPFSETAMRRLWDYEVLEDGTLKIISYKGDATDVLVPACIGERPVSAVTSDTFSDKKHHISIRQRDARRALRSVEFADAPIRFAASRTAPPGLFMLHEKLEYVHLPAELQSLPPQTFAWSALQRVDLPLALRTIDREAFAFTDLQEMTIPPHVRKIGDGAFKSCSQLEKVRIEQDICLGKGVFENCTALREVHLPEDRKSVPDDTFFGTALTDLSFLPPAVECIGKSAFARSALRDAEFPAGLAQIGERAFAECEHLRHAVFSSVPEMGKGIFEDCMALKKVELPEGLERIPDRMFCGCTSLEEIVLPEGLREIGASAFEKSALRRIVIPESVTVIGHEAFRTCVFLEEVDIRGRVEVPGAAFRGCRRLRCVKMPDAYGRIGDFAFDGCEALAELHLPAGITTIGAGAYEGCSFEQVFLADHVRSIGYRAFGGCRSLREVRTSAEIIGKEAFTECRSLQKVRLEEGVRVVMESAFEEDSALSECTFPRTLEEIGRCAFAASALRTVLLGPDVKRIETGAFENCSELRKVRVPAGAQPECHVFVDCPKLGGSYGLVHAGNTLCCTKGRDALPPETFRGAFTTGFQLPPNARLDIGSLQVPPEIMYRTQAPLPQPPVDTDALVPGDEVIFGRFPKDRTYERTPLAWRVLAVREGRALLLTRDAIMLDTLEPGWESPVDGPWNVSRARKLLNRGFLFCAFTPSEMAQVHCTELAQPWGEPPVWDWAFCLSKEELEEYLPDPADRTCRPVAYACSAPKGRAFLWALRTPAADCTDLEGRCAFLAVDCETGQIAEKDALGMYMLRPALWIRPAAEDAP